MLLLQSNKGLKDTYNQYLTPGEYIKSGLNALGWIRAKVWSFYVYMESENKN